MHFINAQKDQAGTYVCKAENSKGAELQYVEVSVLANPTFLEKPENQTLSAGSRLTLNGSFVGSDGENELKISWYLNNALVQRRTVPDRRVRIVGNQDQSLLFIEYFCLTSLSFSLVNKFGLIKAVSAIIFEMIVTTYHEEPLIFSRATFRRDPSPIIGQ